MANDKRVLVSPEKIREAIKNWIDETDVETIETIFGDYFDSRAYFSSEFNQFNLPEEEAKRIGIL
jgi:hypothetical protein